MRIGMISPPWLPVPPPAYGGTEAVIDSLARGLQLAGHDVVLVAHPDSRTPGELRSMLPRESTAVIGQGAAELAHVVAAYDELTDVDVIHDHTLAGPLIGPADPSCPPVVVTYHGHVDEVGRRILGRTAQSCRVVAISHCQADSASGVPIAAVIHHGLDVAEWPMGDGRRDYLLFLGRMVPEKGAHRAIRIARQAGVPLVLAAKMREAPERAYFDAEVRGLLGPDAEYVGEVGVREKQELLRGARALLNPIDWPEPFGMVMLEALASGTPVVARAVGAAPEIVGHGQVGFLGRTDAELARAISRIGEIDRLDCRTWASQRFSVELMTKRYEEQYLRALEEPRAA
jgi:glycosyltransferase involved in cell wall biosynthesis